MKKILNITLILLLIYSCKQADNSSNISAVPNYQAGSCAIGKWSSTPLTIKMSSDFNSDFSPSDSIGGLNPLEQMAKVWNDAIGTGTKLINVPFPSTDNKTGTTLGGFRDGEFGIYKSYGWFDNVSSGALAITQFYGTMASSSTLGTYINLNHADIIFNYKDFNFTTVAGGTWGSYDLSTILLHEMGHFLGLCHESTNNSIMAPYYSGYQRTLKDYDTRKIRGLYLSNQNISSAIGNGTTNALSLAPGTPVKGIVELMANGKCRHFINGKLVFEH